MLYPLHPNKLRERKFLLIRQNQHEHFKDDLLALQRDTMLPDRSKILNLTPFMDSNYQVIRVGGRLGQSLYNEDKKIPLLISKQSKLVPLIQPFHEAVLHGGRLTLNVIRQEYWIINGKTFVNQFIRKCVKSFRFKTTPPVQVMADLPTERVIPARPFSNCGFDFAGLFTIKNKSQKTEKIYIARYKLI